MKEERLAARGGGKGRNYQGARENLLLMDMLLS
jgi:hypothetical protein